ncbi:MAG: SusC/RagA family TonB-linked outer membrane protein [Bacteroidota bacterium]
MKKTLLFLVVLSLFAFTLKAQEKVISGQVTAVDDGSALPGVNVILKGTTTGTITDADGNYKISVPNATGVLVFSFIGYTAKEVPIGSSDVIDVSLAADITQLSEVVVTGTAAGQSKKTLSFSVGSLDEELITTVPQANLGTGLQGKVAGLRVVSGGGQPGRGVNFLARAANSIATGQAPLIILDGTFLSGTTLADINPEDIERIEVLKGSAGASLYGSQAANGVIQIFTKRGSNLAEGQTSVVLRSEVGFADLANERFPTSTAHAFLLDDQGNLVRGANGGLVEDPDGLVDNPWPGFQDYQEQIFRRGVFNQNYVAVQGRSSTTNFLVSGQRLVDEGIFEFNDGYERNAFRLNVDHRLSDKLDVAVSSMYSTSTQDFLIENGTNSVINSLLFMPPIYDLQNSFNSEDGSQYDWDIDTLGSTIRNPYYQLVNRETVVDRTRIIGSLKLSYDLTDWLTLDGSMALDRSTNNFSDFIPKGYLSDDTNRGQAVQKSPTNPGGHIERTQRINNSFIGRLNATLQKSYGDFNTAVRLAWLYEDLTADFNGARGDGLAVEDIRSLDNATTNFRIQSESQEIVANSVFGIADIDYKQKYIFSGLFRREGSSLFGPEERWANYYRLSGAYRITEDVQLPGIQELKVRASIGTAGIRPTFEQRFETFQLRNGSATKSTLGNNFLAPAQSREIELGLNATILDRFNLEFNYVDTQTEDQILRVPLSGAAGFQAQWRNAGTVDAQTLEVSLLTNVVKTNDLSWDVSVTFDRTTQEVAQLNVPAYNTGPGNQQSTVFRIEEGVSFGAIYGQVFATSVEQLAGQVENLNDYIVNSAGFVVRKDQIGTNNEAPIKLENEQGNPLVTEIGDINAKFRMGFGSTVKFKGATLYALFDWKNGGDIYNQSRQWLHRDNLHEEESRFPIAKSFWNGLYNVNVANNGFVEDGSFAMLRELSLSYQFNAEQLSGVFNGFIKGIKVSFIGRNLFTITDYKGFHPDITAVPRNENRLTNRVADGVGSDSNTPNGDPTLFFFDTFTYPQTKTFTGSVQFTF